MQGHLWSETVRKSEQLDDMIFPRLLALAERAWHKSSWEVPYEYIPHKIKHTHTQIWLVGCVLRPNNSEVIKRRRLH